MGKRQFGMLKAVSRFKKKNIIGDMFLSDWSRYGQYVVPVGKENQELLRNAFLNSTPTKMVHPSC